jgi:ABC-type sulfate transport system substrate-binding protein
MSEENGRRVGREYFWFALALLIILLGTAAHATTSTLLNASYDPTREFYEDYNKAFGAWPRGPALQALADPSRYERRRSLSGSPASFDG